MKKYIITTESGSDLSQEMIDRYNVYVVPMHVSLGDENFLDGSFDVEKIFDYYDETGKLPKTSGSTPEDNSRVYREIFEKYPEAHIIHIGYSSVTTVSFNSAHIAARDFENIHFVDSKQVSIGAATIVKETAEFIEANPAVSPEEIIEFVENIRERTLTICLPQTLDYLKAGGRVSTMAFYGANLLRMVPAIVLEDGYLVAGKKYRGSFERSVKRMTEDFFKRINPDPDTVMITGVPSVSDKYKEIFTEVLSKHDIHDVPWMRAGTVISSHAGPGAVGITGIAKASE